MSAADHPRRPAIPTEDDIDDYFDQLAAEDTIAWDAIYAKATSQARRSRVAQLILERGPADYELVDGRDPGALKVRRLRGSARPRHPEPGLRAETGGRR